jgi:hypothetical protein
MVFLPYPCSDLLGPPVVVGEDPLRNVHGGSGAAGRPTLNVLEHRLRSTEYRHRLSLQSSELAPSPASECCPPLVPGSRGGGQTRSREGAGGANSGEGTDTLVL